MFDAIEGDGVFEVESSDVAVGLEIMGSRVPRILPKRVQDRMVQI